MPQFRFPMKLSMYVLIHLKEKQFTILLRFIQPVYSQINQLMVQQLMYPNHTKPIREASKKSKKSEEYRQKWKGGTPHVPPNNKIYENGA